MLDFVDKVAVITGAGRGVGRAIALQCAREGMRVVVVADLDGGLAQQVAREFEELPARAVAVQVDVSDEAQVQALAARAYDEFGEVNVLFNHAGVSVRGPVADATRTDWEWTFAVNLWGVLNGVYAFLPRMRAQSGEAHIVNTASMSGVVARRNFHGVYTASKHAIVGFTSVLRDELEPEGIGVSCWCPSGMLTNQTNSGEYRPARFGGAYELPEARVQRLADPMLPEEVAPRVLEGVRQNLRYIFTHPNSRAHLEEQHKLLWDDFAAGERIAQMT